MSIEPVGTCFGFELMATEPIWLLRGGTGTPLQVVHEPTSAAVEGPPIAEWIPNDRNPIEAKLYQPSPNTFALSITGGGWYQIDLDRMRISTPERPGNLAGSIRLLGLPLLLCCLARGDSTLHAAAVQVDDYAILLAAPGQHGKTSLSASFVAQGHRLLSEDLSCLRVSSTGIALIPGPTGLRIRSDMTDLVPLPGYEEVGKYDDRAVLRPISETGDCAPVRIGAIVLLSDFGETSELTAVEPGEAVRDLWFLSFHLPNDADRARKFQALVDVAATVPIWRFVRPRDRTKLKENVDLIIEQTQTRL
ncbi:MAG TPA: hypothetical protein VJ935_09415 [Acidimicrobiia bacterium]|nr:hypothetical protein [Acidimicrobiia bacterium]